MSTEQNKAAIRRVYEEAMNKGNVAVLNELMAPDYVYHGPGGTEMKGPAAFGQYVAMIRRALPDLQTTLKVIFAEGDYVAHRATLSGTHKGELMGIPPTGKSISLTASTLSRFSGGKEAEAWQEYDTLAFYQQLGVTPPTEQPGK